jgi:hypothetical protein
MTAPAHVCILGLGPSVTQYLEITKRAGNRKKFCDETWAINALGDVFACDRVFHMDDVRVQQIRADAAPDSNIAAMLEWLKVCPVPVYTSRAYKEYPALVEFPLEAVVNDIGFPYFNNTAAYAVAYAIHIGVKKITLMGCDYTYPNVHHAEKGRANVEFLLGIAAARGIKISIPKASSLMDACHTQQERLYGYDTRTVTFKQKGDKVKVKFTERAPPTAEAVELAYDHNQHPSPLVSRTHGS